MGLLDSLRRAFGSAPSAGDGFGAMSFSGRVDNLDDPVIDWWSPSTIAQLRDAGWVGPADHVYRTNPAVRICVNFLSLNIAHLGIKLFRQSAEQDTPDRVRDHPLLRLLKRPNPRTTRFDLMRGTVADVALYDEAFWLKRKVGDARSLYRIPPTYVEPKGGDILTGPAEYVVDTRAGKGPTSFAPEEIVHFHGYNPVDTRTGLSTLQALRGILFEEIAASEHRAGFWRNAARRDGLIERPGDAPPWNAADRERFMTQWQLAHAGGANAGKAPILEDGMTWNADSFSPKDSEFIAGREWALDITATAFHIPLAVLSRKDTATFASMKEFHKVLYVDTLGPWNAMLEDTIWLQLISDFGDDDLAVKINIDEKLEGDFEQQANAARSSVQVPWMSVDEMRAKRGLPPTGDERDATPARPSNFESSADAAAPEGGNALNGARPGASANGHFNLEEDGELLLADHGP